MTIEVDKIVSTVEAQVYNNLDAWINSQIMNNDFLIAGIATVAASTGLYLLRNVPKTLWYAIKKRMTYTVTVTSDNDNFAAFCKEVNKNPYHFLSRHKAVDGKNIAAGYGTTISKFLGHLVFATRSIEESDSSNFKQRLELVFPMMSYKKLIKVMTEFFDSIKSAESGKLKIYTARDGSSYAYKEKVMARRTRESVFTPLSTLEYLEKKIDEFHISRKWYEEKGIPYKLAILLHGPPGTGKTTLAKYLASYAKREVIVTNPENISDLAKIIHNMAYSDEYDTSSIKDEEDREKFLCLMEDIDCYSIVKDRESSKKKKTGEGSSSKMETVNLSKILNSIDGLNSPEDVIIVATTNDLESIDPALVRKGRFDEVIHIGLLEDQDVKRMIKFYVEDEQFLKELYKYEFSQISGASLQDVLINNYKDPNKVLEELKPKGSKWHVEETADKQQ